MMRVAAVGDIHLGIECVGKVRPLYADIADEADVLLLAGDLTRLGTPEEAAVVAAELGALAVPTVAVLGNHDHHANAAAAVRTRLADAGITVLEGAATVIEAHGERLGIAGAKGFGGGFKGACATEFGEPEMKAFVRHTKDVAVALGSALAGLDADHRLCLLHSAPTETTLAGEPAAIHPFLGSYLLGEAVDGEPGGPARAELVVHGHAHRGSERGETEGGVAVRNVAQPLIRRPYRVFCLGTDPLRDAAPGRPASVR